MQISLRSPTGIAMPQVTIELLYELVFQRGPEYWNAPNGSGDVCIHAKNSEEHIMSLILKEPLGFVIQHRVINEDPYVAVTSMDFSRTAEVVVGGEAWTIPKSFLIPKHRTWEAVKEFVNSGKRSKDLEWIERLRHWG